MAEALSPLHSAFHPSFLSFLRATCQIEKIRSEKKVWGGARQKQSQGTVESSQKRVSRCHLICWAARTGGGGVSVSLRFKKKKRRKVVVILSKRRGGSEEKGVLPQPASLPSKCCLCCPSMFFSFAPLAPAGVAETRGGGGAPASPASCFCLL